MKESIKKQFKCTFGCGKIFTEEASYDIEARHGLCPQCHHQYVHDKRFDEERNTGNHNCGYDYSEYER
jgi:hypothetical protein